MEAKRLIITRGLPKTGQTHEYVVGDDGTHEAGWWVGQKVADNKVRFVAETLDGDDIVHDLATGLMWPADFEGDGSGSGVFPSVMSDANVLDFAGFEDWRLPNINELSSLLDYSLVTRLIPQPPFSNAKANGNWSSTTDPNSVLNGFCVDFATGEIILSVKTNEYFLIVVRNDGGGV